MDNILQLINDYIKHEKIEELENIKHDIYQARPEFFNPEQEGSEKYNQGWNEAISCYQSSINQFLDYYISELKGEDNNHNYIGEDEK